jgi:aminoglycoside phosphotransferase (APT) family kinase protein
MTQLCFNKLKVEKIIQKSFPDSKIINFKKFQTGLVSPTYKVRIKNPEMMLVVKLSSLKNKKLLEINNKILEYLHKNKIPTPKIYFSEIKDRKFVTVMDFIRGDVASNAFRKANTDTKKKILEDVGKTLKKIHKLKIPSFWEHHKHEIRTVKQWNSWTDNRIEKYLFFIKRKWPELYPNLQKRLFLFRDLLEKYNYSLVPLHWDYHLSNINVDETGQVTGIFDFDNAMKGHNLADIGQMAYWLHLHFNSDKYLNYFLDGYQRKFSDNEKELIRGYEILHILAVSRTIWFRQKRLGWIIKKHEKILKELLK